MAKKNRDQEWILTPYCTWHLSCEELCLLCPSVFGSLLQKSRILCLVFSLFVFVIFCLPYIEGLLSSSTEDSSELVRLNTPLSFVTSSSFIPLLRLCNLYRIELKLTSCMFIFCMPFSISCMSSVSWMKSLYHFEACVLVNYGSDENNHLTKVRFVLSHFLKCNRKINIRYLETSVADWMSDLLHAETDDYRCVGPTPTQGPPGHLYFTSLWGHSDV